MNFELYPELTNPGIKMEAVSRESFVPEVVTTEQTGEVLLLKAQQYPWNVVQVAMPKDIEEFRRFLNAAKTQGWAEYVEGRHDHIVMNRGNWQEVKIIPENVQQLTDALHENLRNAARWWCSYYQQ